MTSRGFLFALTAALAVILAGVSAVAYEEPGFELLAQYESFEVRQYQPFVIAEVEVEGNFSDAGNRAFNTLFRYIGGDNRANGKMEMTTPVLQAPGEKIEMTTPVLQRSATRADTHRVSFVLPLRYTLETAPEPTSPDVMLRQVPGRVVAALRYSGTWSEQRYRKREEALLSAVAEAGYEIAGPAEWARYNGPFTPWFLRRNEILVELESARIASN